MTISYDILFRVTVNHAYYEAKLSPDFEFYPSPGTQRLLDQFGLIFRSFDHGFMVFARVISGSNPPELFHPADLDTYKFSFLMAPKIPYVLNFTLFEDNTPPQPGQNILYFSNVDQAGGSFPVLGTSFPTLGGGLTTNHHPQMVSRNTYNLSFDAPVNSATPVLRDLFDNTYSPTPVVALPPGEEIQSLQFDLSNINQVTPGWYRISDANLANDQYLYYEPGVGSIKALAVIDLFNNTSAFTNPATNHVTAPYQYLNGIQLIRDVDGNLVADYVLSLGASEYQLNYIVNISQSSLDAGLTPNNLIVNSADAGQTFTATPDGSNRVVIASDFTVTWRDIPQEFVLRQNDLTAVKLLPNPTVFLPPKKESGTDNLYYDLNIYI